MMKYWNDPAVLSKLGGAMGDVFDFEALMPGGAGGGGGEEGEEGDEAEGEEVPNLHSAASEGESWFLGEGRGWLCLRAVGEVVGAGQEPGSAVAQWGLLQALAACAGQRAPRAADVRRGRALRCAAAWGLTAAGCDNRHGRQPVFWHGVKAALLCSTP
jgi:hypothetical protein